MEIKIGKYKKWIKVLVSDRHVVEIKSKDYKIVRQKLLEILDLYFDK